MTAEPGAADAADGRIVDLPSIINFRDYGGYRARDGARLKRGMLYRSSELTAASEADLATVGTLDLQVIVDLRSDAERAAMPSPVVPGFTGRIVANMAQPSASAPHVAAMATPSTAALVQDRLRRYYRESPFRPEQQRGIRLFFEALAGTRGASLVHCAAGKDRTGMVCALLQDHLGVARDDVVADYLLTNDAGSLERRAEAFAYSIRAHLGADVTPEALTATLSVDPSYIAGMFAAIEAACGSVDVYLYREIRLTTSSLDRIAHSLLT